MTDLEQLLAAIDAAPGDDLAWFALADALEENGQPARASLTRLTRSLIGLPQGTTRTATEKQIVKLITSGVRPCVPERTNSLGMRFVLIPAGEFLMGTVSRRRGQSPFEFRHQVTITQPFYLGITPVTQAQYKRLTRKNPSHFCKTGEGWQEVHNLDTSNHPVEEVTWDAATRFCQRLTRQAAEKELGHVYRLPTEAEWEYACRAGTTTPYFFGQRLKPKHAVFDDTVPGLAHTLPVGERPPNAWGLHDMHGNIWEWCQDWYGEVDPDSGQPLVDPTGPASGTRKVLRGGSCYSDVGYCRSACRFSCVHDHIAYRCRGLRLVMLHRSAATRR